MSLIDPATLALVRSALDAGTLRQAAHASNVANAGTPGYRPFKVVYEEKLADVREAVRTGQPLGAEDVPQAELAVDPKAAGAVDLDLEVGAMSRDALHYQALTKALAREYALMNLAISGGRN